MQDQTCSQKDQHKATLVWVPLSVTDSTPSLDARGKYILNRLFLMCTRLYVAQRAFFMMGLFKKNFRKHHAIFLYVGGHLIQVNRKVKILFKVSFLSPAAELCDMGCDANIDFRCALT